MGTYAFRKTFSFGSRQKAEAFSELVGIYGQAWLFGPTVRFTGELSFSLRRKIDIVAGKIQQDNSRLIDAASCAASAGFRAFSDAIFE